MPPQRTDTPAVPTVPRRKDKRAPAVGELVAGKYRLTRMLRRGGMGSVWLATHVDLEIDVAVKFMAGEIDGDDLLMRFVREARLAAQIRSTHVVKIFDHGIDEGLPYMVMELLAGEDLGARIKARGRLSIAETARVLLPVARGLARAHEAGLVHRDLKPENIFLAREGDDEVPKILDFGIAKSLNAQTLGQVTALGTLLGTPSYMSPEQLRGEGIDHRADLWALGVITYRALTGARPFEGKNIGDLILKIFNEPVASVRTHDVEPSERLDAFFTKALARDPAARFQSALDLAHALAALADDGPADSSAALRAFSTADEPPPVPLPQLSFPAPEEVAQTTSVREATAAKQALPPAPPQPRSGLGLGIAAGLAIAAIAVAVPKLAGSASTPAAPSRATPDVPAPSAEAPVSAAPHADVAATAPPASAKPSAAASALPARARAQSATAVIPPSASAAPAPAPPPPPKPARDFGY
jgi:eukaryotic-like serine/threonine-protein kinase